MKIILTILFIGIVGIARCQSYYEKHQQDLDRLNKQEEKDQEALLDYWYAENPNPKKYVMSACDDHCPRYYCRKHHKQCSNSCDCATYYNNQSIAITEKYQNLRERVNNKFEKEQQEENAKAEEEARKKEEEDKRKEELRVQKEKQKQNDKKLKEEADNKNQEDLKINNNSENDERNREIRNNVKINLERQESSKKWAEMQDQAGQDFMASTIFNMDNIFRGSQFIDSHFGLNITISPIRVANVPLFSDINNNGSLSSSTSSATTFYGYCFDAELYALNNKFIYIKGLGSYYYTYSNLGGAYAFDNYITEYFYGGEVGIGSKKIKVFAKYLNGNRNVFYDYSDLTDPNSYKSISGNSNYGYTRLEGGISFHYDDEEKERFIKLSYIQETPDYAIQPISGYGLYWRTFLDLNIDYLPNYPCSGKSNYAVTVANKQSLWSVTLGKTFTLFRGRY